LNATDLILNSKASLQKALTLLEETSQGTIFIVNDKDQIVGTVTDGDVRRCLLRNNDLDQKVEKMMNTSFTSLPANSDNVAILKVLNKDIKVVPLVDDENRVVDYATLKRIRNIPIASPSLLGNEINYVTDCIKTNWISSQGKYVKEFENLFSEYHENFYAVAVSNGTVAIHLALLALGIKPGDEIIVPNFTFAASVNAIIYCGAVPILVDIEKETLNLDLNEVERKITNKTKAILLVHLYGNVCDVEKAQTIANKHKLLLIEDCAESLGSKFNNRPTGVFGDAATFSFYGNKTITTGEGGMVLLKTKTANDLAIILRDHGMNKVRRYWHDHIGYNYRLTNLQAAIGVAQFEQLNSFVSRKIEIGKLYSEGLSSYASYFTIPYNKPHVTNSYWLYTILVKPNKLFKREDLRNYLALRGIETRPVFYPINIMPPYKIYGSGEYLVSEHVSKTGISLPSSVGISNEEVYHVLRSIESFIENAESASLI